MLQGKAEWSLRVGGYVLEETWVYINVCAVFFFLGFFFCWSGQGDERGKGKERRIVVWFQESLPYLNSTLLSSGETSDDLSRGSDMGQEGSEGRRGTVRRGNRSRSVEGGRVQSGRVGGNTMG